jgi:hypothetical protein
VGKSGGGDKRWRRGQGGEMTQTMYAHVNKWKKKLVATYKVPDIGDKPFFGVFVG